MDSDSQQEEPGSLTNKDQEWQSKLSSLQDLHKLESRQQQQQHLEQLKHLQCQLLRELSSEITIGSELSTQDIKQSHRALSDLTNSPEKFSISTGSELSRGVLTPIQSTEDLRIPTRAKVIHSPPMTPNRQYSQPVGTMIGNTTPYKILEPRAAWENGGGLFSSMTPQSSIRGETMSRATLVAKHNKHVEDMKSYYESELSSLRKQLGGVSSSPLRGSGPSSPAQRQLRFNTGDSLSPSHIAKSELWIIQAENDRLKNSCSDLQSRLDNTEREKHILEGQLQRMQQHASEWQERTESSERMAAVLQERLDSTRSQLHDQERANGQMNSDLKMITDELVFWKDQKLQDVDKLDQLFHEFEVLQNENQQLLSMNGELKAKLDEFDGESAMLRGSIDKYQLLESQYKSAIRKLEDEIRHLEHANNRLHGQTTHYDTSWQMMTEPTPSQSVKHSPKQQQLQRSPVQLFQQPHVGNTSRSAGGTPQSATRPLTRRKWLESSIPGLLSGGEHDKEEMIPPPPTSRMPSRMSPGASNERPLKRSPLRADNKERTPTRYEPNDTSIDETLRAVKEGSVMNSSGVKHKTKKNKDQSLEDRVKAQMQRVNEAERRLTDLQTEKERLESALQKTPRAGAKVTRDSKQSQFALENRLEQVVKEIGSARMVLRKHHAFK